MAAAAGPGDVKDGEKTENVKSVKAYNNVDFLTSPAARHIRIMCELEEPMQRLTESGVDNYFLIVGTHLVMHPKDRDVQIADLTKKVQAGGPRDEIEALDARLRFAKNLQPMDKYYLVALELSDRIARWSQERGQRGLPTYHICSGGGPGIMEAANRGARDAGSATLGMGSTRPEWGTLNKYVSPELAFQFHYFFMRKFWAAYKCMGLVVLPGGYGSLDELFEFLHLISSKKITHRLPIVLLGSEFWRKAINFDYLAETFLLSKQSLELFVIMDTAEEAFMHISEQVHEADNSGENKAILASAAKRRRLRRTPTNGDVQSGVDAPSAPGNE